MQSAITPSVAKFSRATSTDYDNFHMSNPNPQPKPIRFKGPRDHVSNSGDSQHTTETTSDFLRFGKRITFGPNVTNAEVLEEHLRQMRENRDQLVQARENKLREEKDYLERVGGEITRQDNIKMRSSNILKNEFLFFNE